MINLERVWKKGNKQNYILSNNPNLGPISGSEKTLIQKGTCTPMFIAALFTIAMVWKPPKFLLTDEQIKKILYIYTYKQNTMQQ